MFGRLGKLSYERGISRETDFMVGEMMPMRLGEVLAWLIYCWTSGFASAMSRVRRS